MFAEERKEFIIKLLQTQNRILVSELTESMQVSEPTIRRDLKELENAGALKRVHGGAVLNMPLNLEPSFQEKEISLLEEKNHIGRLAAGLVEEGDILILDSGTTTVQMIPFITGKNLTVVTNSIAAAMILCNFENIKLILAGGNCRHLTKSLVGDVTNQILSNLHANKAFLGTNAIDYYQGFTTPDLEEACTKRRMVEAADTIYVLADHSKFNTITMAKFAGLEDVHGIVTDLQTNKELLERFKKKDISIIQ